MGNILNFARSNPENIAMAAKFVSEAIAKDKVVIFSKTYCPYCTMAKEVRIQSLVCIFQKTVFVALLNFASDWILFLSILQQFNKLNQAFTAIELEKRDDCAEIQAALGEITGATSVNGNDYFACIKFNFNKSIFMHFRCRVYLSTGISLAVVQTWRNWMKLAN